MPRTVIDYSKCIIYKIVCKDLNESYCYVGHTTNFTRRKNSHKTACSNKNVRDYSMKVYEKIREVGGWDNWEIIVIEEYKDCENSYQAKKKEREWIEKIANLNTQIPLRTEKERKAKYYSENSEKVKAEHAKYRSENSEKEKERKAKYYSENHEKMKERSAKYYSENAEKEKERQAKYRSENPEKLKEKVECICGSIVTKRHIREHERTKKHIAFIDNQYL